MPTHSYTKKNETSFVKKAFAQVAKTSLVVAAVGAVGAAGMFGWDRATQDEVRVTVRDVEVTSHQNCEKVTMKMMSAKTEAETVKSNECTTKHEYKILTDGGNYDNKVNWLRLKFNEDVEALQAQIQPGATLTIRTSGLGVGFLNDDVIAVNDESVPSIAGPSTPDERQKANMEPLEVPAVKTEGVSSGNGEQQTPRKTASQLIEEAAATGRPVPPKP